MMNLESVTKQLEKNGWAARTPFFVEEVGLTVTDFVHRKSEDIFSVFVNELKSVPYIEQTTLERNHTTETPKVKKITSLVDFLNLLKTTPKMSK